MSCAFQLIPSITPSHATQVPQLTLAQLVHDSDVILTATVQQTTPSYDGHFVVTETTLKVDKILKGKVRSSLILRQRGGVLNDIATYVPGMPTYQVGERVLVFLEAKPGDRFVTAGFSQGKFVIEKKGNTSYVQVAPLFYSRAPQKISSNGDPQKILIHDEDHTVTQAIPLAEFTGEISKLVQRLQQNDKDPKHSK